MCMYHMEMFVFTDYILLYIDSSATFSSFQVTIMMQKCVGGKVFY